MSRPSIFISGAAAGIGRATAKYFAARGWFVGIYDLNLQAAEDLQRSIGANAVAGRLDVTSADSWSIALAQFWSAAGERLDVVVNNAGILVSGNFESIPIARHQAIADVNFKGVLNGSHAAFPYLRRTPGSCLINMGSASSIYGQPDIASYSATKFAVRGLTEALDLEWRKQGIRVRDIWPLYVRTDMLKDLDKARSLDAYGVYLTSDDVAEAVWAAVNCREILPSPHRTVGATAWLLTLLIHITPAWLTRLVNAWITKR